MKKFSKTYEVDFYQVGADKKLTLYALMNMIQDIASDHAQILGFGHDQLDQDNFWVLVRQRLVMSKWPSWRDEIRIETFISKGRLGAPPRCLRIFFKDELIGEAQTSWMVLDSKTRRPASQKMDMILEASLDECCGVETKKIIAPQEELTPLKLITVEYSDLDMNFHVNNAIYGQWLINGVDVEIWKKWNLTGFAINYQKEIHHQQKVVLRNVSKILGDEMEIIFEGRIEGDSKAAFTASLIFSTNCPT